MITIYITLHHKKKLKRVSHLLNPCFLEFHNVRMLNSGNKSHLKFPTGNKSQISSKNKSRFQVYQPHQQKGIPKKIKAKLKDYLLMSRSSASFSLPGKPDFFQHVSATHEKETSVIKFLNQHTHQLKLHE